ncbi:restriction endonuclease subunit S [Halorussus pelagicus]|uniref:restriction endonuclease subunit S n=1 Tax=Halorussus pelagicus TaxID=2505977 RepID=UPI000FFC0261|nr:restriction endonuclease subunit S [Halorussus pelagicus]
MTGAKTLQNAITEAVREWDTVPLKAVSEVYPSNVDKKSSDNEDSVRLCNYTDVYYNEEIADDIEFMEATTTEAKANRFRLREGDILITKDSESKDDIGIPAYVPTDFDDVVCGYHLFLIRPDKSSISPRFLFNCLRSRLLQTQFENLANGVTRYGITTGDTKNVTIPLPNEGFQDQIIDFLSDGETSLNRAKSGFEDISKLLYSKRQATIRQSVTTGVRDDHTLTDVEASWIGEVPEHWDVVRTRFVAELHSGHTPDRSNDEYWEDTDIPWVTTSDIKPFREGRKRYLHETENQISELGMENSGAHLLPEGTVFLSRTASVGFSGIMGKPMATSQDFANWVCGDEILPEYLLYVFRSMDQEFDRLMQGSTHKTIYMPDIKSFKTPLPPLDEQREIVEHIETETARLWELIDRVEETINLLEEKRQALITAAVTGQIDMSEAKGVSKSTI